MVQGVAPAHKGLAPSRLIIYLSIYKRCPCWAHTQYISFGLVSPYLENPADFLFGFYLLN